LNPKKLLARAVEKWPAKVLSVAAALMLLVFHRMSTLESRFFAVPLQVESGGDLVPSSAYAQVARVTIRGDANSIYPIIESDIEAYIDLSKYLSEGWYRLPVQVRKKGSALGVEPLEISVDPMEVSLHLERKMSKNIPLIPEFKGRVAPGFDLVSQSISPAVVLAEGPERLLAQVTEFQTDIIDLDGRDQDFSVLINIVNREPLIIIRGNGMAEFRGQVHRSANIRSWGGENPP
jgi:YbbR domain-containing protein